MKVRIPCFFILLFWSCSNNIEQIDQASTISEAIIKAQKVENSDLDSLKSIANEYINSEDNVLQQVGKYYEIKSRYYGLETPQVISDFKEVTKEFKDSLLLPLKIEAEYILFDFYYRSSDFKNSTEHINNLSNYILTDQYKFLRACITYGISPSQSPDNLDRKIRKLSQFIETNVQNDDWDYYVTQLYLNLAYFKEKIGDDEEAYKIYDLVEEKLKDQASHLSYSEFLHNKGRYLNESDPEIENHLINSIAEGKRSGYSRLNYLSSSILGQFYFNTKKYKKAAKCYRKTMVLDSLRGCTRGYLRAKSNMIFAEYKLKHSIDSTYSPQNEAKQLRLIVDSMMEEGYKLDSKDPLNKINTIYADHPKDGIYREAAVLLNFLNEVSLEKQAVVREIHAKKMFEIKYNEWENEVLSLENEINETKISRQNTMLYFVLLVLILLSILFYVRFHKKQISEELESKKDLIKDQNIKMKDLIDNLEKVNNSLSEFTHIAAHDIKTPLLTISGFARILSKKAEDRLNDEELKYLEYIIKDSVSLSRTIDVLLDFSSLYKGAPKGKEVSVESAINDVKAKLYAIINNNAFIDIQGELPTVLANEELVVKLFQNMIHNAIKYSKENEKSRIEISASHYNSDFVEFKVKDYGIGIKEELHEKIFNIFTKGHHNPNINGSGIGLAICKRIVENYNGEIRVESEYGKHTSFYFTLPKYKDSDS